MSSSFHPILVPSANTAKSVDRPRPARRRATRWLVGSIIAVLSVLLLVFIVLYSLAKLQQQSPSQSNLCTNKACISASARLQSNIDPTANPCQDFYSFACGGFQKSHPFTAGTVNSMISEENSNDGNLFEMMYFKNLSKPRDLKEAAMFQTVRHLYGSCMQWHDSRIFKSKRKEFLPKGWKTLKEDFDIKSLVKPLVQYIEDFAGTEDFLARLAVSDTSGLLQLWAQRHRTLRYLEVQPPKHRFFSYLYKFFSTNSSEAKNLTHEFCKLAELNIESRFEQLVKTLGEIVHASNSTGLETKSTGPMPIQELQRATEHLKSGNKFNWNKFMMALNKHSGNQLSLAPEISVTNVHFFVHLLQKLEPELKAKKGPLYDYIRLEAALSAVNFLPDSPFKPLKDLLGSWTFIISKHEGKRNIDASSRFCMEIATRSMPPVAFEMFRSAYGSDSFDSVKEMTGNIKQAMQGSVDSEQWIQQVSKLSIKHKLDALRSTISYPRFNMSEFTEAYSKLTYRVGQCKTFGDIVLTFKGAQFHNQLWYLTTNEQVWKAANILFNAMQVNAFYVQTANSIFILLGLLRTKIYMKGYPEYLQYGGVGSVIGHEIGHAFGIKGCHFNSSGEKLKTTIFDEFTEKKYLSRTQCLIRSYDNLIESQVGGFGKKMGNITANENFADIVGINAAFRAYRASVTRSLRSGRSPQMLPGKPLSGLTTDQLFFIKVAQFHCVNAERDFLISKYSDSPHSPKRPRVNAQMMHSKDFARVFSCKKADPMYLSDDAKCHFW